MYRSSSITTGTALRLRHTAGVACLLATLALLSPGVRVVRADPAAPGSPATAALPAPAAKAASAAAAEASPSAPPAAAPAFPIVSASDVETARRPGVSGIEVAPGVVVLNTRGFNYGPPPTPLAPEAMKQESARP